MILKIKEFREEMMLTQMELARRVSNVQRNVSNWENGISEPDCETILKLAEVLNVSLDELFGRSERITNESEDKNSSLLRAIVRLTDEQKNAIFNLILSFGK